MILHVGPPKTGTTAIQEFLVKNADWLQEQWGITVGFHSKGKAVAEYIVHPLTYFCTWVYLKTSFGSCFLMYRRHYRKKGRDCSFFRWYLLSPGNGKTALLKSLRLSEEKVRQKLKDGLGFLQSKLNSSQLVLLSSEGFIGDPCLVP